MHRCHDVSAFGQASGKTIVEEIFKWNSLATTDTEGGSSRSATFVRFNSLLTVTNVHLVTSINQMDMEMHIETKKETERESVRAKERKWGRYLDDLFCSKYIRERIDEKERRKKERKRERKCSSRKRRASFDKLLVSQPLCSRDAMPTAKKPVCH